MTSGDETDENPFTLKRYSWCPGFEERPDGEWVKYEDILKLVALIRRTRAMVEEAKERPDEGR